MWWLRLALHVASVQLLRIAPLKGWLKASNKKCINFRIQMIWYHSNIQKDTTTLAELTELGPEE